jgi:hypothetical protein
MGILADLFVADAADAVSYESFIGSNGPPPDRFEVQQFGHFTQLELEILWAILDGQKWSPRRYSLEPVGEPGESWLFRFPAPFVERLTRLAPAELPSVATKWGAIEELSCDGDEIRPLLDALVSLAKSAATKQRALFLWGSL